MSPALLSCSTARDVKVEEEQLVLVLLPTLGTTKPKNKGALVPTKHGPIHYNTTNRSIISASGDVFPTASRATHRASRHWSSCGRTPCAPLQLRAEVSQSAGPQNISNIHGTSFQGCMPNSSSTKCDPNVKSCALLSLCKPNSAFGGISSLGIRMNRILWTFRKGKGVLATRLGSTLECINTRPLRIEAH